MVKIYYNKNGEFTSARDIPQIYRSDNLFEKLSKHLECIQPLSKLFKTNYTLSKRLYLDLEDLEYSSNQKLMAFFANLSKSLIFICK